MAGFWDFLSTLVSSKKGKDSRPVIVKTYITGNNNQNNNSYTRSGSGKNIEVNKSPQPVPSAKNKIAQDACVSLQNIRFYSTSSKGKVYTTKFYKSINRNFGIEVILNNTSCKAQVVHLGHCIYDDSGKVVFKGNFMPKINPHSTVKQNIFVKPNDFAQMKSGKYKSQFWMNDKKVQKVFFTVI